MKFVDLIRPKAEVQRYVPTQAAVDGIADLEKWFDREKLGVASVVAANEALLEGKDDALLRAYVGLKLLEAGEMKQRCTDLENVCAHEWGLDVLTRVQDLLLDRIKENGRESWVSRTTCPSTGRTESEESPCR
ncbi:hypothetical protein BH10PLA2_BH10PLA2_00870 [soil metagenome]